MYFLFNADLSKFDSQYYDIRYIHSLLLNSGPWTETGTIKTTLNIKQNKASEQKALNIIPALLHPPVHHLLVHHLPIHHLPHHNNTSSSSERKQNCVQNISAFQSTWFDIQN